MIREIKFENIELEELTQVFNLCQPEHGFGRDTIIRLIVLYYRKHGKTALGFEKVGGLSLVNARKCTIEQAHQTISVHDVIEELKDRKILITKKVQVPDKFGTLQFHDEEKKQPVTRGFLFLNETWRKK